MNSALKKTVSSVLAGLMLLSAAACSSSTGAQSAADNTASAASAAGGSSAASGEKITLKVWHQWSDDSNSLRKDYNDAVAEYEKENPNITIESDSLATEAYKNKLVTAFASNAADVDVFYDWSPGSTSSLAAAGKLLAIDDYVKDDVLSQTKDGSLSAFKINGKLYSLPMFSWYMMLYCNRDLFKQAGVEEPKTYDDLLTAVKGLKAKGILPIANGTKDAWNACFIYEFLAMRENGADAVVKYLNGQAKMDTGYANAAQKVMDLVSAGAFGNSTLGTGSSDADTQFTTGKAAMRIMGSWFAGNCYGKGSTVQGKVDALPVPLVSGGKGDETNFCGGFTETFFVNSATKHPDEAVKFMIYINRTMGKYAAETSQGFDGWKDEVDQSGWNDVFKQINDATSKCKTSVLAWDTFLDSAKTKTHQDDVQALFAKKMTPDQFIQNENASWN